MTQVAVTLAIVSVVLRGQKHLEARVLELPDGRIVLHRSRPVETLSGHVMSVDPRAYQYAVEHPDISEIHLEDASGNLFAVGVKEFGEKAEPINHDGWPRMHLPEQHWRRLHSYYEGGYSLDVKHKIATSYPANWKG